MKLYGVDRAGEAVRRFYGSDPYVGATVDSLFREAGIGEEVEPVDPSDGSAS